MDNSREITVMKNVLEQMQLYDHSGRYIGYLDDIKTGFKTIDETAAILLNYLITWKRDAGTNNKTGVRQALERLEFSLISIM